MKKNILGISYIIIIYLLIIQHILENYIQIFHYFDEFLAILFFPVIMIYLVKNHGKIKVDKIDLRIALCLFLIIIIGVLSNILYGYQELKYVLSDLLVFIKFFLVYFCFAIIYRNKLKESEKIISTNIKFMTITLFILTILNYVFEIFPINTKRFGIGANQLFFGHPTTLAAVSVMLMVNLIFFEKKSNKKFYFFILMQILLIMSSLRIKAIGFAVVSLILIIYVLKFNKKIKFLNILIIGLICLLIGYDQVVYYFTTDGSARAELLNTSIKIANDYFPIGTGFGTFGSYYSGVNYSPLYSMYGINNVWGLTEGDAGFLSDVFWPMILGQFGYIGMALYVYCIWLIFKKIQKNYDIIEKNIYLSKILCLVYLLISSTSESAFTHPIAIPLAIILAI